MKHILFILMLMSSCSLFAQAEFLDTQTTANTTFQLPLRVGTTGEMSFFQTPDNIMFGPAFGAAFSKGVDQYINPVKISGDLSLSSITENRGWMEIRRRRYDGGLGLSAIVGDFVSGSLIPFRGAMQTTIRMKESKDEVLPDDFKMPSELKQLESWKVGDQGAYQRYGGVEIAASAGISIVNLARASIAFQNQFIIELRKVSSKYVVFSIAEEKLQRGETTVGPIVSKVALQLFHGNRFSSEFALDLTNPAHHDLFKRGLAGKINELQASLSSKEQRMKWIGSRSSFYVGIPMLIGVDKAHGDYKMTVNDVEAQMSVKTRLSRGAFTTPGDHNRLVYKTDDVVLLLWNSQMKRAKDKMLEKYFFRHGRAIGIRGFGANMPRGMYGSVLTQIGVSLLREELMSMKNVSRSMMESELKTKCEDEKLSCAKDSKRHKLVNKVSVALNQSWDKMSLEIGKLMIENPILIQVLLKSANIKKEVYIKFLNDNYQSVEGMLSIEL